MMTSSVLEATTHWKQLMNKATKVYQNNNTV